MLFRSLFFFVVFFPANRRKREIIAIPLHSNGSSGVVIVFYGILAFYAPVFLIPLLLD